MRSESVQHEHVQKTGDHRGRRRQLISGCIAVFALSLAVLTAFAPYSASAAKLANKKAMAAKITAEVDRLDTQVAELQEQYNHSIHRLHEIDLHVADLSNQLVVQEGEYDQAMENLIDRAVIMYQSDGGFTQLVHIAKSRSFGNFLDRMETIQRISAEDRSIVKRIRKLQRKMQQKKAQLKSARTEKASQVADIAKSKRIMNRKLAAKQKVLNSVNSEIRKLVAQQQAAAAAAAAAQSRAAAQNFSANGTAASSVEEDTPSTGSDAGGAIAPVPAAAPPPSGAAASAAGIAMNYLGVPYKWGGATPAGFDCSGLIMYAFAQVGISLPHSSYALWGAGVHVARSQLAVGDLIFSEGLGHVGIYVGGGSYVHAPHSGDVVKVSPIPGSYVGAVRIG